jgi:hypothetical protein
VCEREVAGRADQVHAWPVWLSRQFKCESLIAGIRNCLADLQVSIDVRADDDISDPDVVTDAARNPVWSIYSAELQMLCPAEFADFDPLTFSAG